MGSEGCCNFGTLIPSKKLAIYSRMHECVFERVWEIVPIEDDNIGNYKDFETSEQLGEY